MSSKITRRGRKGGDAFKFKISKEIKPLITPDLIEIAGPCPDPKEAEEFLATLKDDDITSILGMTLANAPSFLGEIKEAVYAVAYRAFILSEIAYEDLFVLLDLAVLEIEKNMKNPKAAVN